MTYEQELANSLIELSKKSVDFGNLRDELRKQIELLESKLKTMNLGIAVSVIVQLDESLPIHDLILGYERILNKWGFTITRKGESHTYTFNDAPWRHRILCAAHLPRLLEKLLIETQASQLEAATALSGLTKLNQLFGGPNK